jgi:hypothetical protein
MKKESPTAGTENNFGWEIERANPNASTFSLRDFCTRFPAQTQIALLRLLCRWLLARF